MALTEQQSLQKYGTVAYTAWDEQSAAQDFKAKNPGVQSVQPPVTNTQPATQQKTSFGVPTFTQPQTNTQPSSVQDLIKMGYSGYQGWNDAEALANFKATGGSGKGGTQSSGSGIGDLSSFFNQPSIDLPSLYTSIYSSSGVSQKEQELADKERAFNEATSKINDNPFLSEANRIGRVQKLQTDYNNAVAGLQNEIATKRADVETQLNLQLKQFDINSQQSSEARNQFQTLLASGALNNASSEDIANITRATGLSSSIIQSAIQSNIESGYQTSTQSFDDGINEGFIIYTIDQRGNVVNTNKQVTGKSTSSASAYSSDPIVSGFLNQYLSSQTPSYSIDEDIDRLLSEIGSSTYGSSVNQPNFSPSSGVGTIYKDPSSGVTFKYTSKGWQQT